MYRMLRSLAVVLALLVVAVGLSTSARVNAADGPGGLAERAVALWAQPAPDAYLASYGGEDGLQYWQDAHPDDGLFAFGHVLHVAGRPDVVDSAGPRFLVSEYRVAFPDLALTVEAVRVEGNRVEVRWTLRGTSLGSFAGLAPTGRTYEEAGSFDYRIVDGQIAETWVDARTSDLLRGAGATPLPAPEPWVPTTPAPASESPNGGPGASYVPVIEEYPYTGA